MTMHTHDIVDLHSPRHYDGERRVLSIAGLALTAGFVAYIASLALF